MPIRTSKKRLRIRSFLALWLVSISLSACWTDDLQIIRESTFTLNTTTIVPVTTVQVPVEFNLLIEQAEPIKNSQYQIQFQNLSVDVPLQVVMGTDSIKVSEWTKLPGLRTLFSIKGSKPGTPKVLIQVRDQAGNLQTRQIEFTIQ